MIYDYLWPHSHNFTDIIPPLDTGGLLLNYKTTCTRDWTQWKRSYQNLGQTCRLLRQEVIYKIAHRKHFAWTTQGLGSVRAGNEYTDTVHEVDMLHVAAVAEPQKLNININITAPDKFRDVYYHWDFDSLYNLCNLLILSNNSSMRLRFSTYHDCYHPDYKGQDDIWKPEDRAPWFEAQDLETMLDDLHGN